MRRALYVALLALFAFGGSVTGGTAMAGAAPAVEHRTGLQPHIKIKFSPRRYLEHDSLQGLEIRVTVTGRHGRAHGRVNVHGTHGSGGFRNVKLHDGRAYFDSSAADAPIGPVHFTVRYLGSHDYRPGVQHASIDVIRAYTRTEVSASPASGATAGEPVTFTIHLYDDYGSWPTNGTVTFQRYQTHSSSGGSSSGPVDIAGCRRVAVTRGGAATCTTRFRRGKHLLFFNYSGAKYFGPSGVALTYRVGASS